MPARSAASASVELLGALLEVRARRLLDPVGAVPEVDRVEVRGEDPILAPALLELPRERGLAHLARERPLVPDVGVLDELLRDRRAAFDDPLLPDVLPERAPDAPHVDAVVLEEALILDRDDRLAHDRRDVLRSTRTRLSSPRSTASTDLAVRRVDDRVDVRALRGGVERGDLARDRAHETERERQRRQDDEDAQQAPQDGACEPGAADAASPSLSEPARGRVLAPGRANSRQRDLLTDGAGLWRPGPRCQVESSAAVRLRARGQLLTVDDAERLAEQAVTPEAWSYIVGGAGDERTLRWNREAFSRFRLRPRVLVDVSSVSTETTVLGTPVSMPVLVAPMAFQQIAHEEGEVAMARGAAAAGTLMCLSTVATATPAEIAAAAPGAPRWLQIYVFRDRGVSDEVIAQALEAGFSALVLTADLPVYGIRHREARTGFEAPEDDVPAIVAARERGGETDEHHSLGLLESGLEWDYVTELCERWKVPVIVKGLVTAEDAILACEHGAAGVVVSNHGGRQLDGAIASLEALPEVVEAVGDRAEVYLDGGVRRGTDVVMALALGARAVLVGRPAMYGLAFGGAKGVEQVLEILREETENALALLGCRSPAEVTART